MPASQPGCRSLPPHPPCTIHIPKIAISKGVNQTRHKRVFLHAHAAPATRREGGREQGENEVDGARDRVTTIGSVVERAGGGSGRTDGRALAHIEQLACPTDAADACIERNERMDGRPI